MRVLNCDFPQSRVDDIQLHLHLVMAYAACGYKCPVQGCPHEIAPRAGNVRNQRLERDKDGHLLSLSDEPQVHEGLIFTHWETHHCLAGTIARVKAA